MMPRHDALKKIIIMIRCITECLECGRIDFYIGWNGWAMEYYYGVLAICTIKGGSSLEH